MRQRSIRTTVSFAIAFLLASAGLAGAEDIAALEHTTPEQRASFQTESMKEQLSLTPDQVEKVSALNLQYAKQIDPVLKGKGGHLERLSKARKIGSAKDAAMKAVLTKEQYEKYLHTKSAIRDALEAKYAKPATE